MTGIPCAFVYDHPALGRGGKCGNNISCTRAAAGQTLCAVHDPTCRAKTRAAVVVRQARRAQDHARRALERAQSILGQPHAPLGALERVQRQDQHRPPLSFRDAQIVAIKELSIYWDGPGSEGREV